MQILAVFITMVVYTLPVYFASGLFFMAIGVEQDVAVRVWDLNLMMLPHTLLFGINAIVHSHLNS